MPHERDLDAAQARLAEWFTARIPAGEDLKLSALNAPSAGVSNETLMCDLSWREDGVEHAESLVIRLEPADFRVFPEYDLELQARVMQCLSGTDVPVPEVLWIEDDAAVLGNAFYVMRKIEGEVPNEVPPYHSFGFCLEASPERRAKMWWSGIEALARIHSLDWEALGLSFLGVPDGGTGPLDRQLDYYERFLDWTRGDEPHPILDAALKWLKENRYEPARTALCWGDARLPNVILRDDEVAGVLDWEMAFLGDPEADLGWWLFLDWHHSDGLGIPRLEGFPDKEETIQRYEELTGRKVEHALYNEMLAAFRFGVVMVSVARNMTEMGISTAAADMGTNNPCTQRLATLLELPPPGGRAMTKVEEVTVRVQFHLTGPGGHNWYLVADKGEGTRHEGTVENPDVTVNVAAADWAGIQSGELDRTQAYLGGKLVIEGDLTLMLQLEDMISRLSAESPELDVRPESGEPGMHLEKEEVLRASEVHMATAEDDLPHVPGPDSLPMWNESYWFAFYDPKSEVGATLRLGMHPNQNEANIYLMLVRGHEVAHTLIDVHAPLPVVEENRLSLHGYSIDIERPPERFHLSYDREGSGIDLVWEGFSPTYLYPFPPNSSSDQIPRHIEHAGTVTGTMKIGGVDYKVDCLGHRDHTWGGERDWAQMHNWDYLSGEIGKDFWFNAVQILLGDQQIYIGGLWNGKEVMPIQDVKMDLTTTDGGTRQLGVDLHMVDERGNEHHIVGEEVLAIASAQFSRTWVKDGFARYRYGDRVGYGILEHGYIEKGE